jgi:hypothetical protein
MPFILPKRLTPNFPTPPLEPRTDEREDRFGLPLYFMFLEGDEKRRDRIARTKALIKDAAEAVIRQVGRREARRLFLGALATPPKGKQPNAEENALLLAAYDRIVTRGVPIRRAARVAAGEMVMRNKEEGLATHIRRLVRQRALREAEDLERRRTYSLSPLERASRDPETDL